MDYISTRGSAATLDFTGAMLAGLASDGGLYVPAIHPLFSESDIAAMQGLSYVETAVRVMQPFVADCLSEGELRTLCTAAYSSFAHNAVTPLVQLDAQHWVLELFHGPTLAFKDVALQLLGQFFQHALTGTDKRLTIVGATSGDTGSAAIDAVAGRDGVEIFMLHPLGRISDVQRRQMTTVLAPNVHNIAIEGSFDDAQAFVKRMFTDPAIAQSLTLSAVNSINWARLMAQIVYYFYAAVRLGAPHRAVAFSVPTGNFGDVYAGYMAATMGLPVERLIVATNVNDILHRAISQGDYSVGGVTPTSAPSMDIQVSSNFERLLFNLVGRDGANLAAMMQQFDATKNLSLSDAMLEPARALFSSARVDEDRMARALRWGRDACDMLIDPHTAIGLAAAQDAGLPSDIPVVTLATAHPAKFRDAVERATGLRPHLPARLGDLFAREEAYETLPADYDIVRDHILAHAAR
jgi:threonine synthase